MNQLVVIGLIAFIIYEVCGQSSSDEQTGPAVSHILTTPRATVKLRCPGLSVSQFLPKSNVTSGSKPNNSSTLMGGLAGTSAKDWKKLAPKNLKELQHGLKVDIWRWGPGREMSLKALTGLEYRVELDLSLRLQAPRGGGTFFCLHAGRMHAVYYLEVTDPVQDLGDTPIRYLPEEVTSMIEKSNFTAVGHKQVTTDWTACSGCSGEVGLRQRRELCIFDRSSGPHDLTVPRRQIPILKGLPGDMHFRGLESVYCKSRVVPVEHLLPENRRFINVENRFCKEEQPCSVKLNRDKLQATMKDGSQEAKAKLEGVFNRLMAYRKTKFVKDGEPVLRLHCGTITGQNGSAIWLKGINTLDPQASRQIQLTNNDIQKLFIDWNNVLTLHDLTVDDSDLYT